MGIEFQYRPSPPDLAALVVGFAARRDSFASGRAIELPLTYPLLQFFLGGTYRVRAGGSMQPFEATPVTGLWGPTRNVCIGEHSECLHVFVIILTNLGVARLAGCLPRDTADLRLDAALLWSSGRNAVPRLHEAGSFERCVTLACDWLRALPRMQVHSRDAAALTLADRMLQGDIRGPVERVCTRAGMSPRSLRTCFDNALGCSPKSVLRAARLQRALRQLHPQPWSGHGVEDARLEYFDESHFAKDFAQLTSMTPSQYRSRKLAVGDQLVNTVY